MIRERPILFSAPMVRALLDGRKTQTRRIVKPQPPTEVRDAGVICSATTSSNGLWSWLDDTSLEWASIVGGYFRCPYGVPGDQLWVRETCRAEELPSGLDGVRYIADDAFRAIENSQKAADQWCELNAYSDRTGATVPPIHMPRWASRILLEVTDVRVQRLQDISEADATAEGTPCYVCGGVLDGRREADCHCFHRKATASDYRCLWEQINSADSWDANPWVWAISFKRILP